MLSKNTKEQVKIIKKLIKSDAPNYKYADGLYRYGVHAIREENEVEYGLECLSEAKQCIEDAISLETKGGNWEWLDEWCINNGKSIPLNDLYYQVLLAESEYNLDSFILYMERNRKVDKRFYAPRREVLKAVADDLTKLDTDPKAFFYGLSMPPRIGKLCSDDTPVLTRDGWKNHGDLCVGDYVVGRDGEWVKVTYVHPKNVANCRVHFSDHTYIDCHENHEWLVMSRTGKECIVETKSLLKNQPLAHGNGYDDVVITDVETIEPKQGNCITVEGGLYRVGHSMKLTHNSTICIFFLAWVACKRPNSHSAMGGYNAEIAKAFFGEFVNLLTTEEYTFYEIYQYMHPELVGKKFPQNVSAEHLCINLDAPDRFATLTCRGCEGTWTGAIDISPDGYLYVDDLIKSREQSLSPLQMEKTFQLYNNQMLDRMNVGAKVLMVGTLWSILDPLERTRVKYQDDTRYVFRRIPALNDDDESNFQYKRHGFTTEYYLDMRDRLEAPEWQAKYQQKPFVREGLLYEPDQLNYFDGILPEGDSRVISACDCSFGGGDNLSMPIGREYADGTVYIFDWIHNAGAKEVTLPLVTGKIIENEIRQIRFEGNQGGDMYADYVSSELRKQNYKCACSSKKAPNKMSKMEKILSYAGDIKRTYYFLTPKKIPRETLEEDRRLGIKRYVRSSEYQKAMEELCMTVSVGKNEHEDACDALTQLEMFREGTGVAKIEAVKNPYKSIFGRRW